MSVRLLSEELDATGGTLSSLDFDGPVLDLRPAERGQLRLVVRDKGVQHSLELSLPAGVELPVRVGQLVRITYRARFDPRASAARRALAVRDARGRLLVVFQENDLLEIEHQPSDLQIEESRSPAYTEAGRMERLCYKVVEHRKVRVRTASGGDGPALLDPGGGTEVALSGGRYRFVLVDHARTIGGECEDYVVDRVAWLLVRLPAAASGEPIGPPD